MSTPFVVERTAVDLHVARMGENTNTRYLLLADEVIEYVKRKGGSE
jgi:hypothetical protein